MIDLLLDSWDRQARIIDSLASLVDEENRHVKSSEDGWALDMHLAHIHLVRKEWLFTAMPEYRDKLGEVYIQDGGARRVIDDLGEIKAQLNTGAQIVREAAKLGLEKGGAFGPYDNALLFIQHMVWHEGYHAALILLALRNVGQEPDEMWQEKQIWELWRGPEEW